MPPLVVSASGLSSWEFGNGEGPGMGIEDRAQLSRRRIADASPSAAVIKSAEKGTVKTPASR